MTLAMKAWVLKYFTSEFMLIVLALLVTCVVLELSPVGKIRIGGPDAKPEFSMLRWFAMVLCGAPVVAMFGEYYGTSNIYEEMFELGKSGFFFLIP